MSRFFNTAGPIKKEKHYHIEPLDRIDIDEILSLIQQEKYFVLHAPRQTGKTSYLHALMDYLNKQGDFCCLYANLEEVQAARENVKEGIRGILKTLARNASMYLDDTFLTENWQRLFEESNEFTALHEVLSQWSLKNSKAIILFFDEIDSLVGDTLISVLRQLRAGYTERPKGFPQSIILCGVRDVRDYRIYSDKEKSPITGGSAFNIKAESLRLDNFTLDEIKKLYQEHTRDTGQQFENDIFPLVWDLTEGQPWLVNALGYEVCFKMKEGRDRNKIITKDMVYQARENIILKRETHLDQLVDKLKEDRVKQVIEPIMVGLKEPEKINDEDIDYVVDLGIIKKKPYLRIANKIYQEIIPRQLTYSTELTMTQEASWYMKPDGSLDMKKLLSAFQDFFRQHFESWVNKELPGKMSK